MLGRAALIRNSIVRNIILADDGFDLGDGSLVIQIGEQVVQIGSTYSNGTFTPPAPEPEPIPEKVELAQLRIAIIRAGAAAQLNTHVLSLSAENRVKLEQAKEIRRDSRVYDRLCTALGLNETQRDNLFRAAGNIDLSE